MKKAVFETFSKTHSVPTSFESFGKEDIIAFQEALFEKMKTKVSEKWFYTYFKKTPEKLPRIDMLNLLSQYVGFQNWNEFKTKKRHSKKKIMVWSIPLLLLVLLGFIFIPKENEFHFCFVDEDKNEAVSIPLNIEVLLKNESPIYTKTNDQGCFHFTSTKDQLTFVVKSHYYKTDTISRNIYNNQGEIRLSVDDYAIMLEYYSNKKVKDRELRKKQLEKLIHNDAVIYQLYPSSMEVEIYSKQEFIRLLTIPTSSLKNIRFLDKEFNGEHIVKLKFMVQ